MPVLLIDSSEQQALPDLESLGEPVVSLADAGEFITAARKLGLKPRDLLMPGLSDAVLDNIMPTVHPGQRARMKAHHSVRQWVEHPLFQLQ